VVIGWGRNEGENNLEISVMKKLPPRKRVKIRSRWFSSKRKRMKKEWGGKDKKTVDAPEHLPSRGKGGKLTEIQTT